MNSKSQAGSLCHFFAWAGSAHHNPKRERETGQGRYRTVSSRNEKTPQARLSGYLAAKLLKTSSPREPRCPLGAAGSPEGTRLKAEDTGLEPATGNDLNPLCATCCGGSIAEGAANALQTADTTCPPLALYGDLQRLVNRWPTLPEHIRKTISDLAALGSDDAPAASEAPRPPDFEPARRKP